MTIIRTSEVPDIGRLIRSMLQQAKSGTWNGQHFSVYYHKCRWVLEDLGMTAILTRDEGYHTSGWWKNPDYERCYHLSLSFFDPESLEPSPPVVPLMRLLLQGIFGAQRKLLWVEGPFTEPGKKMGVFHYRLFCDPSWEAIKPRGEVYSRELTEAGWKSYSEVKTMRETDEKGVL